MSQTITKGLLHFEDLEPKLFEYLYRNILVTSDDYEPDIKSYGIKGSDEGVDILCVEKESKLKHFIQCKRYKNLNLSQLKKIVDRIIKSNKNDYKGNVMCVVSSCDIRRDTEDNFEKYAIEKGFSKAIFHGQTYLDSLLHLEKYESIRERFFGSEISKEDKARKKLQDSRTGELLVKENLLKPFKNFNPATNKQLLDNPSLKFKDSEVIIRSIYDENYPDSDTWFKSFLHDIYNEGIQLHLDPWRYETIVINPHGQWILEKDFDEASYEGDFLTLKVNIIGRIPFYNIVNINKDDDSYYPSPHIFCIFSIDKGPFSEICYEYHDFNTNKRILFEPNRRAWICEYDFQQIKEKLSSQSEGLYD